MDFAITSSGDLLLEEFEPLKGFKMSFRLAETNGLNLKFHISEQKVIKEEAQFKLSFSVKKTNLDAHKISLVLDNQQKMQMIRMALMTERGELEERKDFGSRLYLVKHDSLYAGDTATKIRDFVIEAVRDIIAQPEVVVKPEKGVGNFYAQTMGIYIYEEGTLIFKFQV